MRTKKSRRASGLAGRLCGWVLAGNREGRAAQPATGSASASTCTTQS